MVRSASSRVSNHEATDGPASFETRALRAPQDEVELVAKPLGIPAPDGLASGQRGT